MTGREADGTEVGRMLTAGRPFRGRELDELKEFLAGAGLRYEEGIEYSVCLKEGGVITGTGSVE